MYEAALEMLDTFVPYVKEHLAQHPSGKFGFTGHSLGGSIATLLMLLMVHRCGLGIGAAWVCGLCATFLVLLLTVSASATSSEQADRVSSVASI